MKADRVRSRVVKAAMTAALAATLSSACNGDSSIRRDAPDGQAGSGAADGGGATGGHDGGVKIEMVHLTIETPESETVSDTRVAIRHIDRFGVDVTMPYIQSSNTLAVSARIVGPCPSRLVWKIDGSVAGTTEVVCGDGTHTSSGALDNVDLGEHSLEVEPEKTGQVRLEASADSVDRITRVARGDILVIVGESTAEGYGTALWDGTLPVGELVGAFQPTDGFTFQRWDEVPPGTASTDGRTFPQMGATSVSAEISGCGAPSAVTCPVGFVSAGGAPVEGPVYFAGMGAQIADRLAAVRGTPVLVWNLAYGGHTTAALLGYPALGLSHPSVVAQITDLAPTEILIQTGINDSVCALRCAAGGCAVPCGTFEENYRAMVKWAEGIVGEAARVHLSDPTFWVPVAGADPLEAALAAAVDVREETGARRGPALFHWFAHHTERIVDGIHPDAEGYRRAAEFWAAAIAAAEAQTRPSLTFVPARIGSPGSGVVSVVGAAAGASVTYTLQRPDSSISFGPEALPCGPKMTTTTDSFGNCSFAFGPVAFDPLGTWIGTVQIAGASDTAKLVIE